MTENKEPRWRPGEEGSPIGSELQEAFRSWLHNGIQSGDLSRKDNLIDLFCRWLVMTGDGAVALGRIKDCPRQLFLDFGDPDRPYEA